MIHHKPMKTSSQLQFQMRLLRTRTVARNMVLRRIIRSASYSIHSKKNIELNRMAFSDVLPRNSESRALAVTFRMLRRFAPHLKWVISFADATQSGDGAIYRAAGFVLAGIKPNDQIWEFPSGEMALPGARFSRASLTEPSSKNRQRQAVALTRVPVTKGSSILDTGAASMKAFIAAGARPLPGFQLRYIYFLDETAREHLTVPIIPFDEIRRRGASMYKGKRAPSADSGTPGDQPGSGGANPTGALETMEA